MAAACGDDDGGDGGGGSGGMGASGGSGGSGGGGGGSGGAAGSATGGAAGEASGGSAGTPGGGSGGATGGSAGSTAGSAGSGTVEPPDAGPDGSVESDASTEPDSGGSGETPDSGVNGNCDGFTTGLTTFDPQNNQDVVIARVIFNNDDETATAVLRVVNPRNIGGDQVLCWGASNSECAPVDDGITGAEAPAGTEIAVLVGTPADPISVDSGELLFAEETPESDPEVVYAYINWGEHESADVDEGGPLPSLEGFAVAAGFWLDGNSITVGGGDNAIFVDGDTASEDGFGSCTADQFPLTPPP